MSPSPDAGFIALQSALAGEYSLDHEVGRGGMGIVYLAREVRLARPVAIKVLPPELAARADLRDAFLRESQTIAGLNHPNIVQVYAAGERAGFVYMVMAYVDGIQYARDYPEAAKKIAKVGDVRPNYEKIVALKPDVVERVVGERIRSRGPLLPGQAARVLREVAWALAYAHGAGIVHRDISAENIMLERAGERAIVMDFGLASAMQTAALTHDGLVMGNAHYVSPEQAAGEPVDARSDLYSLGITGFYALTGQLPFDGPTSADVVAAHLSTAAPSITSVAGSVPPRLAAAVERCLHKLPIRRYRNAESFAEAIDLAFEHAKEIPAPLRSWINQGERELPARLAMVGIGAITGTIFATALRGVGIPFLGNVLIDFFVPFAMLGGLSALPALTRLRRVLAEGYHTDDLHAALREHQLARSEEIEYERRQGSPTVRRWLRILLGSSLGGVGISGYLIVEYLRFSRVTQFTGTTFAEFAQLELLMASTLLLSLVGLTLSAVPLIGEVVRYRLASRITFASITFWKNKWGARVAKLAGLGLKPAHRPALGMPVLTEVALGRATDHLFHALPKATRKELAALPETVRNIERDATRLRDSITAFDEQLAAFERGGDELNDGPRERAARELGSARRLASERLAATVAALEGIRLDLLRLQMGSAGIESVTASLEAAQRIGVQIGHAVDAQEEIESFLRAGQGADRRALDAPYFSDAGNAGDAEDDADTPVGGVAALRR